MKIKIPAKLRAVIYVANVLGTPVVAYAVGKAWIGPLEVSLWSAEVAAAFALAGLHLPGAPLAATDDNLDTGDDSDDGEG